MEAAGFRVRAWEDVTAELAGAGTGAAVPPYGIPRLVMGAALDDIMRAGERNRAERRIVSVQAVLERRAGA